MYAFKLCMHWFVTVLCISYVAIIYITLCNLRNNEAARSYLQALNKQTAALSIHFFDGFMSNALKKFKAAFK